MGDNYQRLFYILKNMDSDVGYPTGYIKVEINYEVAKLQVSLNNLINRQGLIYQLYGIKKDDNQLMYTVICDVPNENGRADVKISSDINKVGLNKLRLEDINIFAIITQLPTRIPSTKCPLVAYTKGEVSWKREFDVLILNKELHVSNDNVEKHVTMDNTETDIVSQATTKEIGIEKAKTIFTLDEISDFDKQNETEQIPDILDEIEVFQNMNGKIKASENVDNGEVKVPEEMENDEINASQDSETVILNDIWGEAEVLKELDDAATNVSDNLENTEAKVPDNMQTDNVEMFEYIDNLDNAFDFQEGMALQNDEQDKITESILADNDLFSSVQKNFKDISSIEIDADKIKNELNMPSLKEELNKSFESYNPFKMKSKTFKWWKINSPGYLNNILFRNNIKTYLLFSPKVMLAHYKYRYIIFGIRNDRHSAKEYFVCGVPGVYSIDDNPFDNMGSWVQTEGYKPKYGAFGYWIILIDPRTGKLMKIK